MSHALTRFDSSSRAAPPGAARRLREPRVFNRLSRQRFVADRTRFLIEHLGRAPSYPERILINRVATTEFDLYRFDAMLDGRGEISTHILEARTAAEARIRRDLKALGLKPGAAATPTLEEAMAEIMARKAERERQAAAAAAPGTSAPSAGASASAASGGPA